MVLPQSASFNFFRVQTPTKVVPAVAQVLQRLCREIPEDIPIILDAKRAATDEAAEAMANAFYSAYNVRAERLMCFRQHHQLNNALQFEESC